MRIFAGIVLANYLLRALLGAALALPFARIVGAAGVAEFPTGDRILFEPGALYLLELLRLAGPELLGLGQASLRLLVGAGVLLIAARALTYAALEHAPLGQSRDARALAHTKVDLGAVVGKALPLVPGYVLIAGLVLLAQVLTLTLFFWFGVTISGPLQASSERSADLLLAGVAALGLLGALLLGAVGELARACLAHEREGALSAIAHALEVARRLALRLASRWAGFGAAGVGLVLAGAWLSGLLDVSRAGAFRPFAVFVLHQLIVLGLCALHVAWLRTALHAAQLEAEAMASR